MLRNIVTLGVLSLSTIACSSDDDTAAPPDAPCTSLEPDEMRVPLVESSTDPVPPTGGVIAEGHYTLTGTTLFSGSGVVLTFCEEFSGALELEGGNSEAAIFCHWVAGDPESPGEGVRNAAAYSTSGTELTLDYICPADLVETLDYSADASSLRMVGTNSDGIRFEYQWTLR